MTIHITLKILNYNWTISTSFKSTCCIKAGRKCDKVSCCYTAFGEGKDTSGFAGVLALDHIQRIEPKLAEKLERGGKEEETKKGDLQHPKLQM